MAGLALLAAAACAPADPLAEILAERARFTVDLLGWAVDEGGNITVSTRVSGPVYSSLERLTVRVVMLDADEKPLHAVWWTIDLGGVERGGPEDLLFRVAVPEGIAVEGLGIDPVPAPTEEERAHIPELARST